MNEVNVLYVEVMEEADDDEDDKLSYSEFQNIVSRAPNFAGYKIRLPSCSLCAMCSLHLI